MKRAEIIKNQSTKIIKNIEIDNKKLNDFMNFNYYLIDNVAKNLSKKDDILSINVNNKEELRQ